MNIRMVVWSEEKRRFVDLAPNEVAAVNPDHIVPLFAQDDEWVTLPGVSAADVMDEWKAQYEEAMRSYLDTLSEMPL